MKLKASKPADFNFSKQTRLSQFVVKSNKIACVSVFMLKSCLNLQHKSTRSGETKIVLIFVCSQIYLKASWPKVAYNVTVVILSIWHAKSVTTHSVQFFAKIPISLKSIPLYFS